MTTAEQRELDERIERSIHDEETNHLVQEVRKHSDHYIKTGIAERDCQICRKAVPA